MLDDFVNSNGAGWVANLGCFNPCIVVVGHEKGDGLLPVENGGAAMVGFFVVVKCNIRIVIELVEEVTGDVNGSEFCKTFLGEVGVRWMIKPIQVGNELCKLLLIILS